MKKVALLGCGVIGTSIACHIESGTIPATLERIYDQSLDAAHKLADSLESKPEISENAHLLSYPPVDIVVEAASQRAVRDVGLSVIQNRRDLMVMSAGALLDETVRDILDEACAQFGSRIYLPSGAIGGLDAIAAAKNEISAISITTTKHPRSLAGAPYFANSDVDPQSIKEPAVLFSGDAQDAVRLFPANVNVAALVSIVSGSMAQVRVKADPNTTSNTHVIRASGKFGSMEFVLKNLPDPVNPRTSRLAVLAAVETLRRYCTDGIKVGT